jgi:hypothetical protein
VRASDKFAVFIAVLALCVSVYQALVSHDTEQRSLRAYVLVDKSEIGINDDKRTATVNLTMKNFGLTPAYDFRHWACAFVRKVPIQENDIPDITKGIAAPPTIVAPQGAKGKVFTGLCDQTIPITEPERNEIKNGSKAVYVVGVVTYRDAFYVDRITRYRRHWNDALGSVSVDDDSGNCADDSCKH